MEKVKEKKGKTIIKKKVLPLILGITMTFSSMLIAGCGEDQNANNDGQNNQAAVWYRDTANIDTVDYGKTGDFYIDSDDYKFYQKKSDGTWHLITDNFGRPTTPNTPSQEETGIFTHVRYANENRSIISQTYQEGLDCICVLITTSSASPSDSEFVDWQKLATETPQSPVVSADTSYVGYDGYIWNGNERSEQRALNVTNEYVADNTLSLLDNKYFDSYSLSAGTPIALMNNYFQTLKTTGYSGVRVSKIYVYSSNAGSLTIATASVNDVANRNGSTAVALSNAISKTVKKGLNEITFDSPFIVPSTHTLVLGSSQDTARLVAYKGVEDEQVIGSFANLKKSAGSGVYEKTNNVNDKIIVKVETDTSYTGEFVEGFDQNVMKPSGYWKDSTRDAQYVSLVYADLSIFENSTINYISVKTKSVKQIDSNQYVTVRVIERGIKGVGAFNAVATYRLKAKVEDIGTSTNVDKVLNYYPEQPIKVEKGQTLAFYDTNDPVDIQFRDARNTGAMVSSSMSAGFHYGNWDFDISGNENIGINVNLTKKVGMSFGENLVEQKLKNILAGKYVSLLGDSISTYDGYSTTSENNSTINNNAAAYRPSDFSVNETYWKQVIDKYNMNLLVNNSISGTTMSTTSNPDRGNGAWRERCTNLHANKGSLNGTKPDIILLFMGTNDLWQAKDEGNYNVNFVGTSYNWSQFNNGNFTPTSFDQAYAFAIQKMKNAYPDADIFCLTVPDFWGDSNYYRYNDAVRSIANHYGCQVVDLYTTVLSQNCAPYTLDGVHPNTTGMDVMSEAIINALEDFYLPNK